MSAGPGDGKFALDGCVSRFNLSSSALTPSVCARMVASLPLPSQWSDPAELEAVKGCVAQAVQAQQLLPMVPASNGSKKDPRPAQPAGQSSGLSRSAQKRDLKKKKKNKKAQVPKHEGSALKVHSNYPPFKDITIDNPLTTLPHLTLATEQDEDGVTHCFRTSNISQFMSFPPSASCNQFPYEGGFVRKDLLPLTIRRHHYSTPGLAGTEPSWWLDCFDLSTEFHLFTRAAAVAEAAEGEGVAEDSGGAEGQVQWVIKESQGTRSKGSIVSADTKIIADFVTVGCGSGKEYVAQRLVRPYTLLCGGDLGEGGKANTGGRKFDLRMWVFVRSFEPCFEAYLSSIYHASVSNKVYDASRLDDVEVFLTSSSYNDEIKGNGLRLTPSMMKVEMDKKKSMMEGDTDAEVKGAEVDLDTMVGSIKVMMSELFSGLASSVGEWPKSSAYYGVDVMIDEDGQPKLLEINFCGDFEWRALALDNNEPELFHQWGDDLANVILTNRDVSGNDRLWRL